MLIVISPAKTLDYTTPWSVKEASLPEFLDQSAELIDSLRQYPAVDLSALMGISDKLAELNADRYQQWQPEMSEPEAKPAVLAFQGDVYSGLEASDWKAKDHKYAQKHLRILSGLYGVLKPLDMMRPYRLEMGTKLQNAVGKDLYAFWKETISPVLNDAAASAKTHTLVNLASNEYFKAVDKKSLALDVVTPQFKDFKNGQYKMISFYAKKARGMMAKFIIQNQIKTLDDLKAFDLGGYYFSDEGSDDKQLLFLRDEPA